MPNTSNINCNHEYSSDKGLHSDRLVSLGDVTNVSLADIEVQLQTKPIVLYASTLPTADSKSIQAIENRQMIETVVQKTTETTKSTVNSIVPHELKEPNDTILKGLKKT